MTWEAQKTSGIRAARRAIRQLARANPLVPLFVLQGAIGFALAACFVAALLAFDVGGAGGLILSAETWPAAVMLWLFVGLTFAGAQFGVAVMGLSGRDGDGNGGVAPRNRPGTESCTVRFVSRKGQSHGAKEARHEGQRGDA